MKTYKIDFYDNFKCIASECPYTCCRGWGLLVDDRTYANMRKEKGMLGLALRLFTRVDVENGAVLRTVCGRCPFLEKDGLCRLQKAGQTKLVADICNLYPRRSISYGERCEVTVELSCVHAARLFLTEIKRHTFIECEAEGAAGTNDESILKTEPYYSVMNNDLSFLEHLLKDRERILDFLWEGSDSGVAEFALLKKMNVIADYAAKKQGYFGEDEQERAKMVELPDGQLAADDLVFPFVLLNELIYNRLLYTCTKKRNPVMYELLGKYKKQFGAVYETEAEGVWKERWGRLCADCPDMPRMVLAYYSYLLQQTYCCAYETYYLTGPVILAAVSTEFLMLFLVVAFADGQTMDDELIAAVIAGLERAVRHSKSFEKQALDLFRHRK